MKNITTPRTLSESSFTVGYPTMPRPTSKSPLWAVWAYILTLSAAIAAGLVWGLPG